MAVDYFHVLLRCGRLRVVLHGSNLVAETVRRFEVHGTGGSFVKYGMDKQEEALKLGEKPGGPGWGADPQEGLLTEWIDGAPEGRPVPTVPGNYLAYYEGVRDAIAAGAPNPVPPEDALAVMKVLSLAGRSVMERKEFTFPT